MRTRTAVAAQRRFLLLTLVLILLAWAGVAIIGLGLARQALAPVHGATAEAVARAVAGQVDRALGYGIPFKELEGVDRYLADVMAEQPRIRSLQLVDSGGAVLFARAASGAKPDGGFVGRPLRQGDRVIGEVRVGYAETAVARDTDRVSLTLVFALLLAGLPVLEILRCWSGRSLVEPIRQIETMVRAGGDGDFSHRPVAEGRGEIGQAAIALGRLSRHLTRRRLELEGRAEDARSDAYDTGTSARIDGVLSAALSPYRIADAATRPQVASLERPVRRLLTALASFAGLLLVPETAAGWVGLAAGLLLPRLLAPLHRAMGARRCIIIGVMLALGAVAAQKFGLGLPVLLLAGLVGYGAGLIVQTGGEGGGLPTRAPGANWDIDGVAGAAAGAVMAGLLVRITAGDSWIAGYLAPGLLALAGLCALALRVERGEADHRAWLRPIELRALLGRREGAAILLAAALPTGALIGLGLQESAKSALAMSTWGGGLLISLELSRFLAQSERNASRLAARWFAALLTFAASLDAAPPLAQSALLGVAGGLVLAALAGHAQRVAQSEALGLGEARVLIGVRLLRVLGILAIPLLIAGGVVPELIAGVLTLFIGLGALIALISVPAAPRSLPPGEPTL
ncbi:HAMP domain-containing protein [Lacibacterium aquatile]|uniref:HAMP domain-containing protein n=1 Tax=Lacibacterium aquatile TaxID=1168082 RepID=A0ABW5DTS5_9PROT